MKSDIPTHVAMFCKSPRNVQCYTVPYCIQELIRMASDKGYEDSSRFSVGPGNLASGKRSEDNSRLPVGPGKGLGGDRKQFYGI